MRRWLFLLLTLLPMPESFAAGNEIIRLAIRPSGATYQIAGTFSELNTSLGPSNAWSITFREASGTFGSAVQPTTVSAVGPAGFLLSLPRNTVPSGWVQMHIRFASGAQPLLAVLDAQKGLLRGADSDTATIFGPYVAADAKEESDIYFSGIYSPRIKSDPAYTLDISVGYMHYLNPKRSSLGRLGAVASLKTDERKTLDAESFYVGAAYQNYPVVQRVGLLQGVIFHWNVLGVEFSRNDGETELGVETAGKTYGIITAPTFEFPFRLYPLPGKSVGATVFTVRPVIGYEIGNNLQNAVNADGSGLISRTLLGTDFKLIGKPELSGLYKLSLTSSYRVRLLARSELFTITRKSDITQKDFDDFLIDKRARHSVESAFSWFPSAALGLSVKHEYGSLPPLFRIVQHKVTFEITAMLKQHDSSSAAIRRR